MRGRVSGHIRSNLVGYIALFVALSGTAVAAGIQKGTVTSRAIRDNSVKGVDIRANTIEAGDIGNGAITGLQIADNTLTGDQIDENTLDLPRGANGSAGGALTGTYPNPLIAPGAVGPAELANGAVGSGAIIDGAVQTPDIANGSVTAAKIADGAIPEKEIPDGSVTTAKLGERCGHDRRARRWSRHRAAAGGRRRRYVENSATTPWSRARSSPALSTRVEIADGAVGRRSSPSGR